MLHITSCLCLSNCIFCPLPDPDSFKSLKELSLDDVIVSGNDLCSLLFKCSTLEKLCLRFCHQIENLMICNPSSRLKCLSIRNCFQLKRIELFQLNLMDFDYSGKWTSIVAHGLPQLESVAIACEPLVIEPGMTSLLVSLSSVAPRLKSIQWTFAHPVQERDLQCARHCNFPNVKSLALSFWSIMQNIEWVALILGTMPHLERLVLDLVTVDRLPEDEGARLPKLHPEHLREVEIHGFFGLRTHRVLMSYILEIASSLKLIKASDSLKIFDEKAAQLFEYHGALAKLRSTNHLKYLYENVPSGVDFVVV